MPGRRQDEWRELQDAIKKHEKVQEKHKVSNAELEDIKVQSQRMARVLRAALWSLAGLVVVALSVVFLRDPESRGLFFWMMGSLILLAVWQVWRKRNGL